MASTYAKASLIYVYDIGFRLLRYHVKFIILHKYETN